MHIERRILIADDDPGFRNGAGELLSALGLEVLLAESGREAMEIVSRIRVHLALLDVHMPAPDGLEVLGHLLEGPTPIPCILWSGDATDAVEQFVLRRGAKAFLRKPVEPALLRLEVRRVLDESLGAA